MEAEFTNLVKITKNSVLSAVSRTLRPEFAHMIDDIVQETYLRAFKSLKKNQFRYESSLNTWLYTIARNESLRVNKKLLRQQNYEQEMNESVVPSIESANQLMKNDHPLSGKLELLKNVISRLPAKYKAVMELDILGFKDWQIAEKLRLSIGTVKSRNSRAREKVRRWVELLKMT